jgi:predicted O-methyltransferase YrrM
MSIKNALQAFSVITRLRRKSTWEPLEIVELSLKSPVLRPLQVPSELHRFAEIVFALRPKTLVEIGTSRGGTLCVLSRLADPHATIVSVDLPNGEFGGGYKWFHPYIFKNFTYGEQSLHLIRGNSHSKDIGTEVRDIVGRKCNLDLLFIDGDHSYEGVRDDFYSYVDLVRAGGIVAFHDIAEHTNQDCQVDRFWNEIKTKYRHEEIIADRNQGWAGIGILYV